MVDISFLIADASSFIAYLSMPFIFLSSYGAHVVEASGNSHEIFIAGGGRFWERTAASNTGVVVFVTALAGIALAATVFYTARGNLKSPWSHRKRRNPLSPEQWRNSFTPEGKLRDGGIKVLKKVRSAGVDPTIRAEVWPFLLGVFNLNSSSEERDVLRNQKRKEYEKLRKRCLKLLNCNAELSELKSTGDSSSRLLTDEMNLNNKDEMNVNNEDKMNLNDNEDKMNLNDNEDKMNLNEDEDKMNLNEDEDKKNLNEDEDKKNLNEDEDKKNLNEDEDKMNLNEDEDKMNLNEDEDKMNLNDNEDRMNLNEDEDKKNLNEDEDKMNLNEDEDKMNLNSEDEIDSPNTETAVSARTSLEDRNLFSEYTNGPSNRNMKGDPPGSANSSCMNTPTFQTDSSDSDSSKEAEASDTFPLTQNTEDTDDEPPSVKDERVEDFSTWQRIIRLDAIRANGEWISYSPTKIEVSAEKANHLAKEVGLKDYDHLEPCRIFHAARLVAILESYAIFDPEIGYCQGMSDLLSPMIAVISNDHEAFWCFVGFMKKARHNFRLDEVGIRRQLNIVSRIIKYKDSHLYSHLEMLQAGDCFFVYRMVVVLFRRELTFEQTLCLWEVMWADQAAIRSGIGKNAWSRIRLRAPPTEDLLLYAIAASVLQRRKKIIEKYSGMDEILRECNSMAGQLDVWKLLDDAHDLVMNLHNKVETSL